MTIELITHELHQELLDIQKNHEILNFQNVGYQYIDKSKFTEADKKAFNRVEEILTEHVVGFREFNNFCFNKAGEIRIRLQYNYGADEPNAVSFTGVGYLLLQHLYRGFREYDGGEDVGPPEMYTSDGNK